MVAGGMFGTGVKLILRTFQRLGFRLHRVAALLFRRGAIRNGFRTVGNGRGALIRGKVVPLFGRFPGALAAGQQHRGSQGDTAQPQPVFPYLHLNNFLSRLGGRIRPPVKTAFIL